MEFPNIRTSIPGPKSLKLFEREHAVIAPGGQRMALLAKVAFVGGDGALLYDADGNTFIDFIAGVAVASLGHGNRTFVDAVKNQLDHHTIGSWTSEPRINLLELLAEITPKGLHQAQLYSSGAEAVEAALRLARAHTKKFEVIGFWGGFHGKTAGVLGLIGDEFKQGWGPLSPGLHLVPYADPYRGPFDLDKTIDFLREYIRNATAGSLAAILIEPMQGTAGNVVPSPKFLPAVQEIARECGALLIADEMITGFGRTGKWFGVNHTETIPDIMTIGKGMGGGFPISGLISKPEILAAKPFSKPSSSSSSYGGHPLACAASYATLKTIRDEHLHENAAAVGQHMLSRLKKMQGKFPVIGDVRGVGLMIGLDLVKDAKTKELLDRAACEQIYLECLKRGLLIMNYWPRVRIHPPLNITKQIADAGLDVFEEVLEKTR